MLHRQKVIEGFRYVLVELFIVFVGVYLAFQLNQYSTQRETSQRRGQVRLALVREIDEFLEGARQLVPRLDTAYSDWRRRYDAGERPAPIRFEIGGVDRPPRGMWQAVAASDGVTLLSVESLQRVSDFYNALDILLDKYAGLIEFSDREIVPYQGLGAFYEGDKPVLKPRYAAYMRRVEDMIRLFRMVTNKAEEGKASLEKG